MIKSVDKLFEIKDSFDFSEDKRKLFIEAMGEMVDFHRSHSHVYDGICRQYNFSWKDIKEEEDLFKVPHIIVTAFKEMKLLSVPEEEIYITYTSSGTTGTMSQANIDEISFKRQSFTRRATMESYGLADYDREVNYLCFSYDPDTGGMKGAAHTHSVYMTFAKPREIFYAISRGQDGTPEFKLKECIERLKEYEKTGIPLRITGFPSFGYTTLKKLDEAGKTFEFPPESLILSGGGWKLPQGDPIDFNEYANLVKKILGISRDRIRDIYGMIEHGIPYITCEKGNFHIPIYSRVCTVNPSNLKVLPEGKRGLMKLITPYIRSSPSISVLSTDYGIIDRNCECGRKTPFIILKGRAGVKKYSGCAISAAQLLGQ